MDDLTKALDEFVNQRKGEGLVVATVTAVDLEQCFIDCKDGDDNEYLDVRLNATPEKTGLIVVPKVGASVIILGLGNEQEYLMIHAGEIEKVVFHVQNSTEVEIDDSIIRLGSNEVEKAVLGESLNSNLNDLFGQLDKLLTNLQNFSTTQTAATASGPTAPLNAGFTTLTPQIAAVKGQLNTIKTALNDHLSGVVKLGK